MDLFKIWKGCIFLPCLFHLDTEYIMQNDRLDESQPGIKIEGRNINNLRYADHTTLMKESEEAVKSLLMRVKEKSEKDGLKLNIKKLRSWHPVPSLHGKQKGGKWKLGQVLFSWTPLSSKITADCDCSPEIKRCLLLEGKL